MRVAAAVVSGLLSLPRRDLDLNFLPVLVVLAMVLVAPASAQQILPNAQAFNMSKREDVAQVFSMSKQEWRANLDAAVAQGLATRQGDALTAKTPEGHMVTTLPIYSRGDARPERLEVTYTVVVPVPEVFLQEVARQWNDVMTGGLRRHMAPEYVVDTQIQRVAEDTLRLLFTVSEKPTGMIMRDE